MGSVRPEFTGLPPERRRELAGGSLRRPDRLCGGLRRARWCAYGNWGLLAPARPVVCGCGSSAREEVSRRLAGGRRARLRLLADRSAVSKGSDGQPILAAVTAEEMQSSLRMILMQEP
jgi:hypothetical protein